MLTEVWLIELAKGIGKGFLNPLLYWGIILVILAGNMRIKREREQFGFKIFPLFSEAQNMWLPSIIIGLLLSCILIGIGVVLPVATVLLLSVIVIFFSLHMQFTMLSVSYTIGLTYLLILFSPFLLKNQSVIDPDLFVGTSFTSLMIILGLLLLVEAFLVRRIGRNDTFPQLIRSKRGSWIGQHQLKKLTFIPFFILVPSGMLTPIAPFWPYFSIGEESFSIMLVPFLLGFNLSIRGNLPTHTASKVANSIALLGLIVLLFALGSIYVTWFSLVAVFIAILGKEYITYRQRVTDNNKSSYFTQTNEGIKVLGIIPHTPGARLGILVGETIVKVNGKPIYSVREFYEALQASGAYFKLDVIDDAGEVRFVQSPFYAGEHHKLGLIFIEQPYMDKRVAE